MTKLSPTDLAFMRRAFPHGCLPVDGVLTLGAWRCVGTTIVEATATTQGMVSSLWLQPGPGEGHTGTGNATVHLLNTDVLTGDLLDSSDDVLAQALETGALMPLVNPAHPATWGALLDYAAGLLDLPDSDDAAGALWTVTEDGDWMLLADLAGDDNDPAVFAASEADMREACGVDPEGDPALALVCLMAMIYESTLDAEEDSIEEQFRDDGEPWEHAWVDEVVGNVRVKGNRPGARGVKWHNVYVQEPEGPQQKWAYCPDQSRWARRAEPPQEVVDALLSANLGRFFDLSDLPTEPEPTQE